MLEMAFLSYFTKHSGPSTVAFDNVAKLLIRPNNIAPLLHGPIGLFLGPTKPSLPIFFGKCWLVCLKVGTDADKRQVFGYCKSRNIDLMNSQLQINTIVGSEQVLSGYSYQSPFISFDQFFCRANMLHCGTLPILLSFFNNVLDCRFRDANNR